MKYCKLTAMVITVLMLCGAAVPVLADELDEQKQQVQQQAREQEKQKREAQQEEASISATLQSIQSELDDARQELKRAKEEEEQVEAKITANQEVLVKAEARQKEQMKLLNQRMRDIYKNGQLNYIDVLFGASDFSDFTTRMEIWKRIIKRDSDLIDKVKAERNLIAQKQAELEQDRARILELKKAKEDSAKVIEKKQRDQKELLSRAVEKKETAIQAYNELMATSQAIEQKIRNRANGGATHQAGAIVGNGSMIWPIHGEITSPFGWRNHPVFGGARFHSGYDIAADYGDPVVAADGGVVIDAGWLGGYGKAVIIDHGNGLQTLYGHNSELLVSEGQSVRQGQQIARAGSTGYSTGPHVHFEVRRNGSPVDPGQYL